MSSRSTSWALLRAARDVSDTDDDGAGGDDALEPEEAEGEEEREEARDEAMAAEAEGGVKVPDDEEMMASCSDEMSGAAVRLL